MRTEELYKIYLAHPSIQTDTRKLAKGDLFFALKGPQFNGNKFALQAVAEGAAYAIVDEYDGPVNPQVILVEDVLSSLQELAKFHRQQFNIPFIAVTGSNGKTTTKELIHEVLSTSYKTYTTEGNFNNHIGIPLTILKIKADAEIAVIEMGANHLKEIESYCRYTLPTHGLITNCGKAHLEGFGGIEGVRKGKGELFDHLRLQEGTAFVMWDYDYLRNMSKGIKEIIKYGSSDADIMGYIKDSTGFLSMGLTSGSSIETIATHLVGAYNFPNVLAAVAIGKHFNVKEENIKTAIENYHPSNSRSQLMEKDGKKIILDAYNANPSSMKAAIENFAGMQGDEKILLLGGMMELGSDSIPEHQAIIDFIGRFKWKAVVLVGGDFMALSHPYVKVKDATEAGAWFKKQDIKQAQVLVKGSRSMQMEKVLEKIT